MFQNSKAYLLQNSEEIIVGVFIDLPSFAKTTGLAKFFCLGQETLLLFSAKRRGLRRRHALTDFRHLVAIVFYVSVYCHDTAAKISQTQVKL